MHRHHRFPGSRAAENTRRSGEGFFHQGTLGRMKEHPPLFQGILQNIPKKIIIGDQRVISGRALALQGGPVILGVHRFFPRRGRGQFPFQILHTDTRRQKLQHLTHFRRKLGRLRTQLLFVGNRSDEGYLFLGNPQTNQFPIPQSPEETPGNITLGPGIPRILGTSNLRGILRIQVLDETRTRINGKHLVLRPPVGPIVMIHPEKNKRTVLSRIEENAPVGVVDTNRAQLFIPELRNMLVVDRRGFRVRTKTLDKILHLALGSPGQSRKGIEEIPSQGKSNILVHNYPSFPSKCRVPGLFFGKPLRLSKVSILQFSYKKHGGG